MTKIHSKQSEYCVHHNTFLFFFDFTGMSIVCVVTLTVPLPSTAGLCPGRHPYYISPPP